MLVVYALALAAVALVSTIRGRGPARWQLAFAIALEAGLVLQAIIAGGAMARGDGPEHAELGIGYLVSSILVLPAVTDYARRGGTRWDSLMIAIAAVAIAAIVIRMGVTWSQET